MASSISLGEFLMQHNCCPALGLHRLPLCIRDKRPPACGLRRRVRGWSAWRQCRKPCRPAGLEENTRQPHEAASTAQVSLWCCSIKGSNAVTYVPSSPCVLSFSPNPSCAPTCGHWRYDEARWTRTHPSMLKLVFKNIQIWNFNHFFAAVRASIS